MVFSKALFALPLLLTGASAMFNASADDFLSVYRHNKIKIPAPDATYESAALDAQARDILERATQAQAAPHWTIYQDRWISGGPPPVANVKGYNAFYLSFILTAGPWDMAQEWVSIGASARANIKAQYQAAGIKLMVAAFGATDAPTSAGLDPVATANKFADFVKTYSLDGIDVDYEDFNAFAAGTAENWLISFTTQLRAQLPASAGYIITHAPVAPWFTPSIYPGGGYLKVHRQVGSLIDWYNLQFYNQGTSEYTTCSGLLDSSSATWPQTAVFQIGNNGVPLSKLVIGKPATTGDANNGFMSASTLAGCLQNAKNRGWNGGAMVWQYPNAAASWIQTVRSSSWPV
jgi:chitinase